MSPESFSYVTILALQYLEYPGRASGRRATDASRNDYKSRVVPGKLRMSGLSSAASSGALSRRAQRRRAFKVELLEVRSLLTAAAVIEWQMCLRFIATSIMAASPISSTHTPTSTRPTVTRSS